MNKAGVLASLRKSDLGRGQGQVALMVMHLSGMSRIPTPPSRMNRSPRYPDGAGDLPMGQHFPRGVGSPRQKAQGAGLSPVAQLCRGPSQVRKNAQKPATFLSMLPARPQAPRGQAPELNNPGKGTGGAELASAAGFSLQPHSAVYRQDSTACLSPASLPGEGRSHLELHLARQPTEPQEAGCCGQSPGSHPGQEGAPANGEVSRSTEAQGPQEESRKPHCSKGVKAVQATPPREVEGPAHPPTLQSALERVQP